MVLEREVDQEALDPALLEGFLVEEQEEQGMDLVDMGLELDLCLGQVTDQVEAMVQDQGLDMEQAMELDQNLLNTVKVVLVLVGYLEVEQDEVVDMDQEALELALEV
ncbi:uncharacterized protein PEZ65_016202 [Lycodopsis pacificus]